MTLQSHFWAYIWRKTLHKRIHVPPMFIAALFRIAKTWKQPKCPSVEKWIKMWCIHTMEYCGLPQWLNYSATKMNGIVPFAATWMHLEIVILSEVRHQRRRNIE